MALLLLFGDVTREVKLKKFLAASVSIIIFLTSCKPGGITHVDNLEPSKLVALTPQNCVNVYYDRTPPEGWDPLGFQYAVQTLNLLGHFAEYQRHVTAVEDYVPGELQKCGANIYLDTNYYSVVPESFLSEFKTATTQVAWVGENSYKLGPELKTLFGVEYNYEEPYTTLDRVNLVDGKPSFYKNVSYKGEVFNKYGEYGKVQSVSGEFYGAWEISKFNYNAADVANPTDHRVISQIEHNFTHDKRPWAIQSGNRFLIAEVPLSYVHAADRYFIFADLLFDILKAQPRHNSKPALVRIEDVHCETDITALERVRSIYKQNAIKPEVSIIPIFYNPLNELEVYFGQPERPMTDNRAFLKEMDKFKADGAEFIWHGITHQLGNLINPWESTSGTDYEFWDFSFDVATNHPWPLVGRQVPGETVQTIVTRFKKGSDVLKKAGIAPEIWLTPHYHGSSLSNYVFGQLFNWTVGRVVYYENSVTGLDLDAANAEIKFPLVTNAAWNDRNKWLSNLKVVSQSLRQNGQLYPYEIYGDVYGQRVFPENIGNVEKDLNVQVLETRVVSQMLTDAKRNLVLRDVWGSGFYHPYYLQPPYWAGTNTLKNNDLNDLLSGLKNLGYKFVSLQERARTWTSKAKDVSYHVAAAARSAPAAPSAPFSGKIGSVNLATPPSAAPTAPQPHVGLVN